jgi:hypothetical protein
MADSIIARITANRKAALAAITTAGGAYTFTPAAVEEQRITQDIDGRYPFILLSQEEADDEDEYNVASHVKQRYTVVYLDQDNDEKSLVSGVKTYPDEIFKHFRNVNADLIKAWMADRTCGGLAEYTRTLGFSQNVFNDNGMVYYASWVTFEVEALIDSSNPYLKG